MAEKVSPPSAPADGEKDDRRSKSRTKDPQLIKTSVRVLRGKAQLFPSDISVILQALMDISDSLIELRARLEALESTAAEAAESAGPAAGTASPAEVATDA